MPGTVRAGMGGWIFPPWRGTFYPMGLKQKDELAFASRQVSAIEINATYYKLQTPEAFARWAAETPDDFIFAIKGSQFCTNRKVLAGAGEGLARFFGQGLTELGPKLGPILWQFMPTKKFEAADFAAFLELLPARLGRRALRHCVEVRNASFVDPAFVSLCRQRGVAICQSENADWPLIDQATADFAYARLMKGEDGEPTCYPPAGIEAWAERFAKIARKRDVFAFFINHGKVRAPAGARALLARLDGRT